MKYAVDADIAVASTLDPSFYRDEAAYALARFRFREVGLLHKLVDGFGDHVHRPTKLPNSCLPTTVMIDSGSIDGIPAITGWPLRAFEVDVFDPTTTETKVETVETPFEVAR